MPPPPPAAAAAVAVAVAQGPRLGEGVPGPGGEEALELGAAAQQQQQQQQVVWWNPASLAWAQHVAEVMQTTREGEQGARTAAEVLSPAMQRKRLVAAAASASASASASSSSAELNGVKRAYVKSPTSKHRGVLWDANVRLFRAKIKVGTRPWHLGTFTEETQAAHAYDTAAAFVFGDKALLNFPSRMFDLSALKRPPPEWVVTEVRARAVRGMQRQGSGVGSVASSSSSSSA